MEPATTGAAVPYPRFLPRLTVQIGTRWAAAILTSACTCSAEVGATAAKGRCRCGSMGKVVAVGVAILFGRERRVAADHRGHGLEGLVQRGGGGGVCGVQVACLVDVMTRARIITLVSGTGTLRIRKS